MRYDSHHARVLLCAVHGRWDEAAALVRAFPFDPSAFVEACRASDVHPWVHDRMVRDGAAGVLGDEAAAGLGALRARVRRDNLLLLARTEQALDRLRAAGVAPVALKGLDFLHRVYTRFDQRTLDDVDLLVRREDLSVALEALRGAGWRTPPEPRTTHYIRSSHHLPLTAPGPLGVDFELHWNLAQEGRYSIDAAALIGRAEPLEVAGRTILRLADTDAVAHLLLHHTAHYFDRRLKWLVDLERLFDAAPDLDLDEVAATVRRWSAGAATAFAVLHLARLAPERLGPLLRRMPPAAWRVAATAPLRSRHPLELFRGTHRRRVQLFLAAALLEHPSDLPGWLLHRRVRDRRVGSNPLDPDAASTSPGDDAAAAGSR